MWTNTPKEKSDPVTVEGEYVETLGVRLYNTFAGLSQARERINKIKHLFNSPTTLFNDPDVPFNAGIGTWEKKEPKVAATFAKDAAYANPEYFMDGIGDMDGIGNMDY